jgi:succinate dehydrogenase / fumarate reductase cytochrome b subunit
MKWLFEFLFKSSIGRKVVMSLSGLFLILFLIIHLLGNLQLLKDDGGMAFNMYTYFMTHNPVIKAISYILYFTILLHTFQGIYLAIENRKAKGKKYAVKTNVNKSYFGKYMIHLGIIIFIFLMIHLYQFWLQMKLGNLPMLKYDDPDRMYADLYTPVIEAFRNFPYVLFYVVSMVFLALHLLHGFHSAFQSLGLNHKKYNSLIKWTGIIYSVLISLGFSILPVYIYLTQS